jgi:hypothetical protein
MMAVLECERCGKREPDKGYRFCKACRRCLLAEMQAARYLTPRYQYKSRSKDEMEDRYETKYGVDE